MTPLDPVRAGLLPIEPGPFVAIAVRRTASKSWHTGIVYREADDSEARLLHLYADRDLRSDPFDGQAPPGDKYVWVLPPLLDRETVNRVVLACRSVARRIDGVDGTDIRFAVRYNLGRFDPDSGEYVQAEGELGLTCATCVLAVFRGAEVDLIDIPSWPPREEDRPWFDELVEGLRNDGDRAHAERVAKDGLCARFRPLEVAGACFEPSLPVPLTAAEVGATKVRAAYEKRHPLGRHKAKRT